jgi:hypothetical protein
MVEPYRLQHIVVSSVWTQVGVAVSSAVAIKGVDRRSATGARSTEQSACIRLSPQAGNNFGAQSCL